jgi:hypothetical protein
VGRFDYLIAAQRGERKPRVTLWPEVVAAEWRPAKLGRLGRRLSRDVDTYLEFLAIARNEDDRAPVSDLSESARAQRVPARGPSRA